jgi:DUF971 family protein
MSMPSRVVLRESKDALTLTYSDGQEYTLPAEYLRVYSPSAEVRGHGEGNETLQFGKRLVTINALEKAGNYALQIVFSDGHDSGITAGIIFKHWLRITKTDGRPIFKNFTVLDSVVILIPKLLR